MEHNINISEDCQPYFAAVRRLIGRGLAPREVGMIDAAIVRGQARRGAAADVARLGSLSERYESGGHGPGTVSGGQGDPGGVSYGLYQLASRTGTAAAFVKAEGAPWRSELAGQPGSPAFSAAWKAIAQREGAAFGGDQHAFIERTHYRPAVERVRAATGYDIDRRAMPSRDAAWSAAVQHGAAARLLIGAVEDADAQAVRTAFAHDRAFIEALYARRAAHVRAVAGRAASAAVRRTLTNVVERRYPDELVTALASLPSLG